MTRLPPLKARQVIRGLERLGFEKVRQKGSHAMFHHEDCRRAPIPIHPTTDINPYFLSDVLKQLEISEDQFLKAIRRKYAAVSGWVKPTDTIPAGPEASIGFWMLTFVGMAMHRPFTNFIVDIYKRKRLYSIQWR